MTQLKPTRAEIARYWALVERSEACWTWRGYMHPEGYGQFTVGRRNAYAHRVALVLAGVDIPDGMHVDHLCRNRACVNPDHLEPVTRRENILRGVGITAENHRKVECLKGHPLKGSNLYMTPDGRRQCVTCQRARVRKYRARSVEAS